MILNSIYHTLDKLLSQAKQSLQTPGMRHVLNLTSGTPETRQETEFAFQKLGQEAEFLVDQKKKKVLEVEIRGELTQETWPLSLVFCWAFYVICFLCVASVLSYLMGEEEGGGGM